jgi:putative NADH-flavin reductase
VGQAAEIAADPVSPLAYARPSELTSKTRALLLVLGGAGRVIIDDRLRLVTFDEEAG